jgi:hypothetical protein
VRRAALAAAALAALGLPPAAGAHGIGGIRDLPVPGWLFYYAAVLVLVVSFVGLGLLWRRPRLENSDAARPLPSWVQRILLAPALRVTLQAVSFALLVLVTAAALFGKDDPAVNLAPTFVYVVFWLGLVPLSVALGNVWSVLNPWRAAADGAAWLVDRVGGSWSPPLAYPAALGRWPGAVLLFAFATLELTYQHAAGPRPLGVAIVLYSAITWTGMALVGRSLWLENGDAFAVYFGFLARMAPFAARTRDGSKEIVVRPPLVGLTARVERPGTLAFIAVMLGSVAFDGFSRTSWWLDRRYSIEREYAFTHPGLSELLVTGLYLLGLIVAIALVALAYLLAVAAAQTFTRPGRDLTGAFLGSLVPIAVAYVVAHYFSLFILQGQFVIPLASDPFGWGWDLVGTDTFRPNLGLLTPNLIWYVQVTALVVGHVLGLVLAHDRAVSLFRSGHAALRAQYALLVLMVLYTVAGLWLLSNG